MNLSNSMRIFFCVASSGGTIFNTLRCCLWRKIYNQRWKDSYIIYKGEVNPL